ncbi:MAG: BTAD domain-containing putative transcriptional regulator [Chloroflexota bacterium]
MTDSLQISSLGKLIISTNGIPISNLPRKAEALLVYLATTRQPQSREHLAGLLWPEYQQGRAAQSLRVLLSRLRQSYEPYLVIRRQDIELHTRYVDFDVWHLEAGLENNASPIVSKDEASTLAQLLSYYETDFLADFVLSDSQPFEEWVFLERERLRLEVIKAFDRLLNGYLTLKDYETGIQQARRFLQIEPMREETHRQLMEFLVFDGQRNAALQQFEICRQILQTELGVTPTANTIALYDSIRQGELASHRSQPALDSTQLARLTRQDWGDAPHTDFFYGRENEQVTLHHWLINEQVRLAAILGMGGQGKTALAAKVSQQIAPEFDYVVWRSLLNAPPLSEIVETWLTFLIGNDFEALPDSQDAQLNLLFNLLRQHRCLFILDNAESIMLSGDRAGYYRDGYEDYGQLIKRMGGSEHNSCLILTSREKPKEFSVLERLAGPTRAFNLAGLSIHAGEAILLEEGLIGVPNVVSRLVDRYSGNPLALILVSETIQDLYLGDIEAFLQEEGLVFEDIRDVLDQQFQRLSAVEREIMFWLMIEREPITAQVLQRNLADPVVGRQYLEAFRSLQRRSLLQSQTQYFMLQNVILEYLTSRFIEQVCQEVITGQLSLFIKHALRKAEAKDYIRLAQGRLILEPIARSLQSHWGQIGYEQALKNLLAMVKIESQTRNVGYAPGNILNLLCLVNAELQGLDFSNLPIWQASLQDVSLRNVNFTQADLTTSTFSDTFISTHVAAYSPQKRLFAKAQSDHKIYLWRMTQYESQTQLDDDSKPLWAMAFSADDRVLVSKDYGHITQTWLSKIGQPYQIMHGHTNVVYDLVFSPQEDMVISCSGDQTIGLWDVETGDIIHQIRIPGRSIRSIDISPDGKMLVSTGPNESVCLWSLPDGEWLQAFHGHSRDIDIVRFSPDGKMVVSAGIDATIRLWHVEQSQHHRVLEGHTNEVYCLDFSPDGRYLASAGLDQTIRVWDLSTGQMTRVLTGLSNWVSSIKFSPDGRFLTSASDDQIIRLWDVQTGLMLHHWQGYTNRIYSIGLSANGKRLVNGGDQCICIWDTKTDTPKLAHYRRIRDRKSAAINAAGDKFVTGGGDNPIQLWDAKSGELLKAFTSYTRSIQVVTLSADGNIIASAGLDGVIVIWDVQTGDEIQRLYGHDHAVVALAFSPNNQHLISGSWDHTIRVWNPYTGEMKQLLEGHEQGVHAVALHPDGQLMVSGGTDNMPHLWDFQAGALITKFPKHDLGVSSLAFHVNEPMFITASGSIIQLWDIESKTLHQQLDGHTQGVRMVIPHPDGRHLFSSSSDETMRLWDLQSGQCLQTWQPPGPYDQLNILEATGLTPTQRLALKSLGAVESQTSV